MAELKHVGRIISTKQRCLVAYRTLPGDSHYCLVIPSDSLTDAYHNSIINLVESQAAQDSYEFAEVLMRNYFSDGNNMLKWLHANGLLLKMATSSIEMCPTTSITVQLSELNQIIAEQRGVSVDDLAIPPSNDESKVIEAKKASIKEASLATPTAVVEESKTVDLNDPIATAKHYRSQADKLAKEAANFRRLAEELVPTKKKAE
jgi:hypothetical protein